MARVDNTGGSGFTVDNGTGLVVRTKLNQVIGALSTLNQGSGEMSIGVAAYVPHIDGNTLKIRNAANNAFVSLGDVSLANFGHASLSSANTFTARATFSVTSSITLPSGTTAQRDGSPAVGMIRHNSETNTFEGYNNGAWGSLSGASGISNVVDDTSPQLGGNLDLQAFELNTSTSNGNLKLNPNGTGVVEVKGDGSSTNGKVQLNCSQNSHGVKLESPDHSASQSYTIKLPDNQIAADKFLKVKSISGSGSTAIGQLEFADGSGGVTSDGQNNTVAGTGAGASFSGTDATDNTLFGKDAGNDITTGDANTAFGSLALDANTSANNNSAFGYGSLSANTTAGNNTAVGYAALLLNTTGESNVAVGANAGDAITTGSLNVAIGLQALTAATTSGENTCVGGAAGRYIGSGQYNTAIGRSSLHSTLSGTTGQMTGNNNTAVGKDSLFSNTTGDSNNAVGANALDANTTGDFNNAIGQNAMGANTTGHRNSVVGQDALQANTTGARNTAIGNSALANNTTASNNTAVGTDALADNTTGSYNTALGYQAADSSDTGVYTVAIGYRAARNATGSANNCIGGLSGDVITTGFGNNLLGYGAGGAITTGYTNQFIGQEAGNNVTTGYENQCVGRLAKPSAADGAGQVVLGHNLTGKGNNTAFIGGSSGAYNGANITTWTTTSDERIKKNIVDNNIGLDAINQIQIRNFEYRTPEEVDSSLPSHAAIDKEGIQVGVIAQELEKVLPECVKTQSTGVKTVDSNNITWYLVNAIKELSAKVTALEAG